MREKWSLTAIRAYQHHLSRHTPRCRLEPSCSAYALQQVRVHGTLTGLQRTLTRVYAERGEPRRQAPRVVAPVLLAGIVARHLTLRPTEGISCGDEPRGMVTGMVRVMLLARPGEPDRC